MGLFLLCMEDEGYSMKKGWWWGTARGGWLGVGEVRVAVVLAYGGDKSEL